MHAICTVHNIVANKNTLKKLQGRRDPRTKYFNAHLRTLKDAVRNNPEALPREDQGKGGPPKNDTRIFLAPFIIWVKENNQFSETDIPAKFFELAPPGRKNLKAELIQRAAPPSKQQPDAGPSGKEADEARYLTWAKLLIALAMRDYGLEPKFPAKDLMAKSRGKKGDGLYAPLSKYCTEMGIARLTTSDTVRKAFESALTTLGKDFVKRLELHKQNKESRVSLQKAAQTSIPIKTNV